jgi:Tol biopolymer transport system component
MFCTTCASPNPLATAQCTVCGAQLSSGPTPTRTTRSKPRGSTNLRTDRVRERTPGARIRRALYLIPILIVLVATAQIVDGSRSRQRAAAAAYHRAEAAVAAGDYLEAIDAYADAAGYRDAMERRAEVVAQLAPYRDAYFVGVTAFDAGNYDQAIASLLPIVRDLPTFEDAAFLLERARAERQEAFLLQIDQAEANADWLTVENSLASLVAEHPNDIDLTQRLAAVRREHSPLVFAREGYLYLIGPDGSDERMIMDQVTAAWPVWSPDRARIAFVSMEGSSTYGEGSLYLVDGDGANLTEVTDGVRPDVAPAWSPDGTRIAYIGGLDQVGSTSYSTRSIRYMDLTTNIVTDLTHGIIANPASPSWSPTGDRLAFVSRRQGESYSLDPRYPTGAVYVATIATGDITIAAPGNGFGARRVSWSPTRDALVIFSRADTATNGNEIISMIDLQTGQRPFIFGSDEDVSTPVWSPDGNRFAFVVDGETLRIETVGGGSRAIDLGVAGGRSLTWSPDGETVIVLGTWSGATSIVVPLHDQGAEITPIDITFDTDRRFSGAPQWAPLTSAAPLGPPTFSGTAGDSAV